MTLQLHIFAWALVVSMAAVAVTTVAYAVDAVDGMAWRWRGRRALPVPACPWCDDRACIDSTLCDCIGPCGRRYCKAPEVETVP